MRFCSSILIQTLEKSGEAVGSPLVCAHQTFPDRVDGVSAVPPSGVGQGGQDRSNSSKLTSAAIFLKLKHHQLNDLYHSLISRPHHKGTSGNQVHIKLLHFLEILQQRDLISRCCTMQQQFEGGVYRGRHTRMHTASVTSLLYARIMRVCTHILLSTLYHAARF